MELTYNSVLMASEILNLVLLVVYVVTFALAGKMPFTLALAKLQRKTWLQVWRKDMLIDGVIPDTSSTIYRIKKYGDYAIRPEAHWTLPNGVRTGIVVPDYGVMISPLDIIEDEGYEIHPMDVEGRIQEAENIARAEEARTFKPEILLYAGVAIFILVMAYGMLSEHFACSSIAQAAEATKTTLQQIGTGAAVGKP